MYVLKREITQKIFKKNKKSLDKLLSLWYNIRVVSRLTTQTKKTILIMKGIDTMSKKKTIKEMFEQIKNNYNLTAEEIAFIDSRIAITERKNSKTGKLTPTQQENENLKAEIIENMVEGTPYTVTDLIKSIDSLNDKSNQKVSALVRQLLAEGKLVKSVDKRKSYFTLS